MSNQNGEWLSIREAALLLGTSELTVRRRIKDGRLPSRLDGGKYFVRVGGTPEDVTVAPAPVARHEPSPSPLPVQAPHMDLDAFFAEHARLAESAGKAQLLQQQLELLQGSYATLQDGAMALANRNGWLESKLEERNLEIKLLEDGQAKVSWWRRLFGGG